MKIIPSITLRDDLQEKSYPPGIEADVSDDIGLDAVRRGLATKSAVLEAVPETAPANPADEEDD